MKKNKLSWIFVIFLLITLLTSLNVDSVCVSSPYWDERPLYVQPGEVKEIIYLLQNNVGSEDVAMKAEVEGDSDIMQLIDTNNIYDVPLGSEVPVKAKITVPANAKAGDEWQVGVLFTVTSKSIENQPLTIGTAYSKGFKVIVQEESNLQDNQIVPEGQEEKGSSLTWLFIAIIFIVIITFLMIKKSSRKDGDAGEKQRE